MRTTGPLGNHAPRLCSGHTVQKLALRWPCDGERAVFLRHWFVSSSWPVPLSRCLRIPGPNVNGIENIIPENCYVEQVAYVVRHGSRYPDSSAYNEWVALYKKVVLLSRDNVNVKGNSQEVDSSCTVLGERGIGFSSFLEGSPYKSWVANVSREPDWVEGGF